MQILCEENYRSLLLHGSISPMKNEIAVNYQIITIFNFHNSRPSKYCFETQIFFFSNRMVSLDSLVIILEKEMGDAFDKFIAIIG